MIRPYRQIPAAERNRTRDHEAELVDAAADAHVEGWQHWEADPIAAEARRLDLMLWPALRDRLMRAARYG
jgi:hypothetical protein